MKKILSTKYSAAAFNFSMLFLRVVFGLLIISKHGYDKLVKFSTLQYQFYNFLGLGSRISLGLAIFAEVLCALFIVIGLFTRLACIPLVIAMSVALFSAHQGDFFGRGEAAGLFLIVFFVLLFTGPGKVSLDRLIAK